VQEVLARYEPHLRQCRRQVIGRLADAPAGALLINYFQRGKMLRALLVFQGAAAAGADPATVTVAAEAMELLHGGSLVHDDIIDDAARRRGLPALHTQVGTSAALVLGDYLLLRCFDVLGEARAGHAPERVLEALARLNRAAQGCCRGALGELGAGDRPVSEETYFAIVEGKTAALFAAAAAVGAILGGGDRDAIAALHTFGLALGTAFQLRDDVLDLIGEARTLGKPVANSLGQGRPLLPLLYLQKYGTPGARDQYRRLRRNGFPRRELLALLERERIFPRVRAVQDRYVAAARRALDGLPPSAPVKDLQVITWYAVERCV
jgi:geranylgeranyl pyrophosphate synthase